jgi:hypothetical protein
MTQNTSSAVMQQRTEAHDSLDDFPTPPWATRALFEHVIINKSIGLRSSLKRQRCWEPCANRGYMVAPLKEYFGDVPASDIFDYGAGFPQHDFLMPYSVNGSDEEIATDWIVTNPPFRLAEQIIQRGRDLAHIGVAVLVRSAFLEGTDRYNTLFSISPPTIVAQFSERVIMHKGVLRDPSKLYWTGTEWRRPSTATSYTWLVWIVGREREPMVWIPPCRRQLERPGDYPDVD